MTTVANGDAIVVLCVCVRGVVVGNGGLEGCGVGGGLWGGWRVVGWLEGCGVGGGLWGGWRVLGWLRSRGEARRSCSEAAQCRGGGVCHVERQLELKWLPLDEYKYI